jgi:hypothetical protein
VGPVRPPVKLFASFVRREAHRRDGRGSLRPAS